MKKLTLALGTTLLASGLAQASPTTDELYQIIQKQQSEINALKSNSAQQEERLNLTADTLEKSGSSASATTIGGYAEMHYNNLNTEGAANDKDQIDFHRFVLFVGHEFNNTTRFFSEVEIEHVIASADDEGEVELEQAYVEHDITSTQHVKVGQFLVPVGIINETHEPNTFYGVERNNVERNIIPATWWEGGVGFNGQIGAGFSYDAALTSGLNLYDADAGTFSTKIRDARQEMSEAQAEDFATTARVKYTGVKGLEVAASLQYQNDMSQGQRYNDEKLDAVLTEAHVIYSIQGFSIKALRAQWHINSQLNKVQAGAARQKGYYIEPSYRINDSWGVFARGSEWDNTADDAAESAMVQYDLGVNYWLNPKVAFKFDIQDQHARNNDKTKEFDGFNLGVGISF